MRIDFVLSLAFTLALSARPAAAEDLYVDASQPAGDGSLGSPYQTISAAVARARNDRLTMAVPDSETIVVHVRAGEYFGSYDKKGPGIIEPLPILIDVPNLEMRGDTVLTLDADGWPTGAVKGTETSLTAITFLGGGFPPDHFMFLVGPTSDRLTGANVTIDGFVLDGGMKSGAKLNGVAIGLDRVAGASIAGNVITRAHFAVFARASTAAILGNLIHNCFVGPILNAGPAASPASYLFQDNRSVRNNEAGVTAWATGVVHAWDPALTPVPADALYDEIYADVIHNDLSDNNFFGDGAAGILCAMYVPVLHAGHATGHLTVDVEGNRIAGNTIGIVVDAGFSGRAQAQPLTATFHGTFADNEVTANDLAPALVTFTRTTAAIKQTPSELNSYKYLEDSLYEFIVADDELAGFWYDNPSSDPGSGVVLDNTLLVNGVPLNGRNIP
jgi:hypothetical protein